MLSLTCLSPANVNIFQQPSLFSEPKIFSGRRRNYPTCTTSTSTRSCCFFCQNDGYWSKQLVGTCIPEETQDTDLSTTSSVSRVFNYDWITLCLQSCCGIQDVRRMHTVVLKFSESTTYLFNNLICAYLKLGELLEARKVFDGMPERNVVSWTAMIDGYFKLGLDDEALRLFGDSVKCGVRGNGKTFVCVLKLCSRRLDFEVGKQVHACIVKGNWRNLIVDSAVVYFYAQCGDLISAFGAFDQMVERDVVSWTTVIAACSQRGHGAVAIEMFSRMLNEGFLGNEFTVCSVLMACGEEKALKFGRQLHAAIVKRIYKVDVFIGTSLVDMYAKCGNILDSRRVFNRMRNRNTVTWTSIIAGYARIGLGEEAIGLFQLMKRRKVMSNNLTIVSVLRACGSIGALVTGRELHAQIVKDCTVSNEYLGSTLVWFYCKCGESRIASRVLHQMPLRDVVSWTAIISGYTCLGHEPEALRFLKEMMEEGVEPNPFTYSSALKACANLEAVSQGKLLHSFASKTSASSNMVVSSALIHMYSKCGHVSDAFQVFNSMPNRNLASWKAMIMGYAKNGRCREALKLMYRMQAEGVEVDDYIFATVLGACGNLEWEVNSSSGYCLLSS